SLSFFFQAEDGIRVYHVTGVQTCALPILMATDRQSASGAGSPGAAGAAGPSATPARRRAPAKRPRPHAARPVETRNGKNRGPMRSEERRVGKEGKAGWRQSGGTRKRNRQQ